MCVQDIDDESFGKIELGGTSLFRTKLSVSEDEELSNSKHFWNLIEVGKSAQRLK